MKVMLYDVLGKHEEILNVLKKPKRLKFVLGWGGWGCLMLTPLI